MIASEQDEELKKAYTEMLEGCLRHPDQWGWYAIWMIEKTDGTHIGDLCFKGLREDGTVVFFTAEYLQKSHCRTRVP